MVVSAEGQVGHGAEEGLLCGRRFEARWRRYRRSEVGCKEVARAGCLLKSVNSNIFGCVLPTFCTSIGSSSSAALSQSSSYRHRLRPGEALVICSVVISGIDGPDCPASASLPMTVRACSGLD